ncbi:hypothetical protein OVA24_17485 [Luteolibacter sp. SL250]|uniref:hypothetical protein n=1 Tax=Luteolibacter sp. SL250 TaxID=2995170 RepID=UPI002270E1E8|nr:hypothetical protein [Luteolibacter sp. SL250]WAC19025.1 hypothetical protein OVA24_17485 [Luteolibacter sp. SL250]
MNLIEALSDSRLESERPSIQSCAEKRSPEEKADLYEARRCMLYLPQQGTHGGLSAKIARECDCSRHYAHITLFPEDPRKLFGNCDKQRLIWHTMAKLVRANPLLEPMREAFVSLETNGEVVLKTKVSHFKFFVNRAEERGIRVSVVEELNTSPRTYKIIKAEP